MTPFVKIYYHFVKIKHIPKNEVKNFFMELQICSEQGYQYQC